MSNSESKQEVLYKTHLHYRKKTVGLTNTVCICAFRLFCRWLHVKEVRLLDANLESKFCMFMSANQVGA